MFGLFKPKVLGPPAKLRIHNFLKVEIEGTGHKDDPIRVFAKDKSWLVQSYRLFLEFASKATPDQIRQKFDHFESDWNEITDLESVQDLLTEAIIFYTYLGFRPSDWDWVSRSILRQNNGAVISQATVENKKGKRVETYYFNHFDFFSIPGSDYGLRLSLAATLSLNQRFSGKGSGISSSSSRAE